MVRMRDIAKACGVSKSTVSLAMNKPHKISKEQKEKVLKVAQDLGYFKAKSRALDQVLIVAKDLSYINSDPYYSEVLAKILYQLQTDHIVVEFLDNFKVDYSDIYRNKGIIFLGDTSDKVIDKALSFRIPFVLCGHPTKRKDVFRVRFDIENGIYEILEYAKSCGHKHIALVLGMFKEEEYILQLIKNSYLSTMRYKSEKYLEMVEYSNVQTMETKLLKLLDLKPQPTAILFADDVLAYVAYKIFKKNRIKMPEDISIMGFDGISTPYYMETPDPFLTTVYSNRGILVENAVTMLKNIINKPAAPPREMVLPVEIRIGDSVKKLKYNFPSK